MFMKKNIFRLHQFIIAILVAGAMVSCDKHNDFQDLNFTPEELAEMAAADKFAAANSVYRALALIDELPDNWESTTFTPAEGVPVDEANTDMRNVISTGADQAKNYFLSIVPDEGLNGDTWSHEGVGSLSYRAVKEDNCYAVIDVNLVQMPGLKQLRFVPESVVGENKWQGTPYYGVGDVVKDKKGIYWICVRPSGGPLAKDNAYFVSFDKSLIKTMEQKQDIYEAITVSAVDPPQITRTKIKYENEEQFEGYKGKWVYAKNLVEERIALAAAHVFAYFADAEYLMEAGVISAANFLTKNEHLKEFFDPSLLSLTEEDKRKIFYIAYGSYTSASKKNTQVKYIQPLLSFTLSEDNAASTNGYCHTLQRVVKTWASLDPHSRLGSFLSLTDSHDPFTNAYYQNDPELCNYVPFSILNYALTYSPYDKPQFSRMTDDESVMFMPNYYGKNIPLVMTQLSLKDHGKPASGYELVSKPSDSDSQPDYWTSIAASTRMVFEGVDSWVVTPVTE
jgi:hypothetical protein